MEPFPVRHGKGQTTITVYPLKKREGFVFRYYLGGKSRTVERREREDIVREALRIRTQEICGSRKDEAQEQLEWNDVFWEDRLIRIRPEVGKPDEGRMVPIKDNLYAWLLQWRGSTGYIVPRRTAYDRETARLSDAAVAGTKWRQNALRHSHASYEVALDRDLNKLTAAMGNSVRTNRKYYQNPQLPRVAKE